jgi:hypothetical protein
MCHSSNLAGPTSHLSSDSRRLAQRALACEISGDLDHAVALIRCLQRSDARPSPYPPGAPGGGARRIA